MHILQTIPMVRSLDEQQARAFYCDLLGFEVEFEHRFAPELPLFLGLKLGATRLYVSEHSGDVETGGHIVFEVAGLWDVYDGLLRRNQKLTTPLHIPKLTPHVARGMELMLIDPFGNRIDFWEPSLAS